MAVVQGVLSAKRHDALGGTGLIVSVLPCHGDLEHDGQWWMTTDRKEETRRLNRLAGRLCYCGRMSTRKRSKRECTYDRLVWHGDEPTLRTTRFDGMLKLPLDRQSTQGHSSGNLYWFCSARSARQFALSHDRPGPFRFDPPCTDPAHGATASGRHLVRLCRCLMRGGLSGIEVLARPLHDAVATMREVIGRPQRQKINWGVGTMHLVGRPGRRSC